MDTTDRAAAFIAGALGLGRRIQPQLRAARHRLADGDVRVFDLEGMVRGRVPARVIYAGRASQLVEVKTLLFDGPLEIRELGHVTPFDLQRQLAKARTPSVDLLLREAWPWESSDNTTYVLQAWLDGCVDPGRDYGLFLGQRASESVLRAVKRARQWNVQLEVTTDRAAFEEYYRTMLLPLAQRQFGRDCHVSDLPTFLTRWEGAEHALLLVKENGVALAGGTMVFRPAQRELAHTTYGTLAAVQDDKRRRQDASTLVNDWAFREASRRGMYVNLALTRPFLDDGVLQYKRQWGCRFLPIATFPRYRLQFVSRCADDILAAATFFHLAPDGIRGESIYSPQPGEDPARQLAIQLKGAIFEGLRGVRVHVRGDAALMDVLTRALPSVRGCPLVYVGASLARPTTAESATRWNSEMQAHTGGLAPDTVTPSAHHPA